MKHKLRAVLRVTVIPVVVIAAVLLAWKFGYFELDRRRHFVDTVQRLRLLPFIEPAFIGAYTMAVIVCLPVAVLTLLGGAIFGPLVGALLSWGGAMLGTVVTHVLAHRIARAPVKRLFGEHRLLKLLKDHDDVKGLFRLRVLPVAPFGVLDYAAGLANVSLRRLLAATAIGVVPSVLAYAYVGAQFLSGLVSEGEATRRGLWMAAGVTTFMLMLSLVPTIARRMRR